MQRLASLLAAVGAAAAAAATQRLPHTQATVISTVYTHGEGGFPCIRIPSTLALPFDVMLVPHTSLISIY